MLSESTASLTIIPSVQINCDMLYFYTFNQFFPFKVDSMGFLTYMEYFHTLLQTISLIAQQSILK